MPVSLIGAFHILTATIGLVSGVLAMVFRKGSGLHGAAGSIFFVSMLSMSASGAYHSAFVKPVPSNVISGLLTFYLVATAWRTARRRDAAVDLLDGMALFFILTVGVSGVMLGLRAAIVVKTGGMPAPVYFVMGSVALLCAVADVRLCMRGGVSGTDRIVRHLWRMCLALLIGLASFYPGQAQLFLPSLRETNLPFRAAHPDDRIDGLLAGSHVRSETRTEAEGADGRSARHVGGGGLTCEIRRNQQLNDRRTTCSKRR